MLGHGPVCSCPFCKCAARVTTLFEAGAVHPGFHAFACCRLRLLEAELRDELQRLGPPVISESSAAPPAGAPTREGVETSQSEKPEETKEKSLNLTAKTAPTLPPASLGKGAPEKVKAKEEPPPETEKPLEPEVEGSTAKDSPEEAASSSKKPKEKKRSRDKGGRGSPRSRSRGRRRRDSKKRRRSDSRRRRRGSPRDRSSGGKEKKSPERPPEPRYPPRHVGPIYAWGPREPPHPPPRQGVG